MQKIGDYHLLKPFTSAGSGTAQWTLAQNGENVFFLKKFLSPVYPSNEFTTKDNIRIKRCISFSENKSCIYHAASCIPGNILVPISDFFLYDGHYYSASSLIEPCSTTAKNLHKIADTSQILLIMSSLAECLYNLHCQGIVYADFKPEHILFTENEGLLYPHLIDIDSAYFFNETANNCSRLDCDPVYTSPETYLYLSGQNDQLPGPKADIFSLALIFHILVTGSLPELKCADYPYSAVLSGQSLHFFCENSSFNDLLTAMTHCDPACRADDADILQFLYRESSHFNHSPAASHINIHYSVSNSLPNYSKSFTENMKKAGAFDEKNYDK